MAEIRIKVNGEPVFGYTEETRDQIDATLDKVPGSAALKEAVRKASDSAGAVRSGVGRMARSGLSFARVGVTETAKFSASTKNLTQDRGVLKARAAEAAAKAATGVLRQAERTREIATQTAFEALAPWMPAKPADAE